jgi:phosphohistidine phosphatase
VTARAVVLLRHGKSDWDADDGRDLARPLAERGRRSAAAVGRFIAAVGQVPDVVLCSPATRARQTADIASEAGGWTSPVEICEDLYSGALADVIGLLQTQPADIGSVMLVGHEPTSSRLTADLIGGGRHRIPTAALARVGFDTDRWADVGSGRGRLEWLVPSRLLLAAEG